MQLRHLANRFVSEPSAPQAQTPAPLPTPAPPSTPEPQNGPNARVILASIGELVYEWDFVTDRLAWGSNLKDVLGPIAEADLASGVAFGERISVESVASRYDAIMKSGATDEGEGVPYQAIYALTTPRESGSSATVWVEDAGRWFKGGDDRPARAHGVIRVITERHEKERQLARNSQFDPLTGVMNRAHLAEHIQRFLVQAERTRKPFAVTLVALENLFALNRTYGYDAGDELIAGLAKRLKDSIMMTPIASAKPASFQENAAAMAR